MTLGRLDKANLLAAMAMGSTEMEIADHSFSMFSKDSSSSRFSDHVFSLETLFADHLLLIA